MTLLTVNDLAAMLQVKEKTIYAWASQRKIPFIKVGSIVRFDPNEIEQWLRNCHVSVGLPCRPMLHVHKTISNDVDLLIENAKRAIYSTRGETSIASPFGEEGVNGTR